VYSGDSNYSGVVSTAITQTVKGALVGVTSSPATTSVGQSVTFTANLTGFGGPTPTGTVTFEDGSTVIGQTTVNGSGVGTFSTSQLTQGRHNITAIYSGDSNFSGVTSPVHFQVVVGQNSSNIIGVTIGGQDISGSNDASLGQTITIANTIAAPESGGFLITIEVGTAPVAAITAEVNGNPNLVVTFINQGNGKWRGLVPASMVGSLAPGSSFSLDLNYTKTGAAAWVSSDMFALFVDSVQSGL